MDKKGRKWRKTKEKVGIVVPSSGVFGTYDDIQDADNVWELVDEENIKEIDKKILDKI
jgi:hypothetical protein